jgi:3-dehydroquinate synthase
MTEYKIPIKPDASYTIRMQHNIFSRPELLDIHCKGKRLFYIIDGGIGDNAIHVIEKHAKRHHAENNLLILKGGEQVKNDIMQLNTVLTRLDEAGLDRKDLVIITGGGAVLDLAGFVCSVFHRGIEHIRIPTTLLSQIDAGIGTKNGINFNGQKNFIGAFFPPKEVIIDPEYLKTLSTRELVAGIAEALKVALIKDKELFEAIEKHYDDIIELRIDDDSSELKRIMWDTIIAHLEQIKTDPYESEIARPLDFGHQWGHRIEILSDHALNHGEAVAIGMAIDSTISYHRGYISENDLKRILKTISNCKLPTYNKNLDAEDLYPGLEDFRKHLGGELTITLLESIGTLKDVHSLEKAELKKAIDYLSEVKL